MLPYKLMQTFTQSMKHFHSVKRMRRRTRSGRMGSNGGRKEPPHDKTPPGLNPPFFAHP